MPSKALKRLLDDYEASMVSWDPAFTPTVDGLKLARRELDEAIDLLERAAVSVPRSAASVPVIEKEWWGVWPDASQANPVAVLETRAQADELARNYRDARVMPCGVRLRCFHLVELPERAIEPSRKRVR